MHHLGTILHLKFATLQRQPPRTLLWLLLPIPNTQVCREELFVAAVQHYISKQLGPSFVEVPSMTLMDIYLDSSPYTPIIFLLAQGADAIADLARFAASEGRAVGKGLQVVSLGQGQGPVAEALVRLAMKSGDWVCLQVRYTAYMSTSWAHICVDLMLCQAKVYETLTGNEFWCDGCYCICRTAI